MSAFSDLVDRLTGSGIPIVEPIARAVSNVNQLIHPAQTIQQIASLPLFDPNSPINTYGGTTATPTEVARQVGAGSPILGFTQGQGPLSESKSGGITFPVAPVANLHNFGTTPVPQHQYDFNAIAANLNKNLQQIMAARDAAIRKSGSSAAGPYNDAIAAIQKQMQELQVAKQQTDQLYGQVSDQTGRLYDQAISVSNFGPQAQAHQAQLAANLQHQRQMDYNKAYADTNQVLKRIGVDSGTAQAVAGKVNELKDQIMNSDTMNADFRDQIAQASGELAQAAAQYAKAKDLADLGRKRVEAQLGIDKNLQDLADQKEQLIKARSRAVAAARDATASQYGGLIPKSADEYGQWYVSELFREAKIAPGQQQLIFQLVQEAANPFTLQNGQPDNQAAWTTFSNGAHGFGTVESLLQEHAADGSVSKDFIQQYAGVIWEGVQLYRQAMTRYQNDIAGADPSTLFPNTMDRAASNYAHAYTPAASESDLTDYALSAGANQGWSPKKNIMPLAQFSRS